MTAVIDTRHLPSNASTTATVAETIDDAWVHQSVRINKILSPSSDDDLKALSQALHRPVGTASSELVLSWATSGFEQSSSTLTSTWGAVSSLEVPPILAAAYDLAAGLYGVADPSQEETAQRKESMASVRAAQRKRDRRAAVLAGILSGLGIRPRRPRDPYERMEAALARASQTELIDARY